MVHTVWETKNRDPVNEKASQIQKVFSTTNEIHSLKIEKNPDLVCSSREQDDFIVQIYSKSDKTWAELWERGYWGVILKYFSIHRKPSTLLGLGKAFTVRVRGLPEVSVFILIPIKNNGFLKTTIDLSKQVSKVHERPVVSKGTWSNTKLLTEMEFIASFYD